MNTLHIFTYLISTVVSRYDYSHFIDEIKKQSRNFTKVIQLMRERTGI